MIQPNPFLAFRLKHGKNFRIILEAEFEYNQAREISNSFFNRKPKAVAYPRNTADVAACIAFCKEHKKPFRVRSGGHNHEGMSSLDEGLVIRMSDMSMIQYEYMSEPKDRKSVDPISAWIGVGTKLGTVYNELEKLNMIIPAGGCFTVNTGGLALGGGWGMHSRKHGLTCDNLLAIELVTAKGEPLTVTPESDAELFRALCGGGQGNFGVVTRLQLRLHRIGANQTWFRFGWNADKREEVAREWMNVQSSFPKELTSFVRMSVTRPGDDKTKENRAKEFPIYAGGLFYGTKEDLKALEGIKALLDITKPVRIEWQASRVADIFSTITNGLIPETIYSLFGYDEFTMGLVGGMDFDTSNGDCVLPAPPSVNCNAPHPHKVSSAFPKGDGPEFNKRMAAAVASYLNGSAFDPNVRSYMTFHAMGGAIKDEPTAGRAFPWANKEFLLQFQSWWNYPEDQTSKDGEACMAEIKRKEEAFINWVKHFRGALAYHDLVEGAFINFVDKDLPAKDKNTLLAHYFGKPDQLERLMEVKQRIDPKDQFNFPMSIPLPELKKSSESSKV